MKKANVNLFDKNKVQVKLLKNKKLRISDGRKNPTRVVDLQKTGITIWTDGKHLRFFRGNRLKEVIGRSVHKTNKFQTMEFISESATAERRRSISNAGTNFIGMTNIHEGLISNAGTNFIGMTNIHEGLISNTGTNLIGMTNIHEGRSITATKKTDLVDETDGQKKRVVNSRKENILVIGSKDASEARTLNENYGVHISLSDKFVTIRHGKV